MNATRATQIAVVVGPNCDTRHVVPRELTARRLQSLMDAVFHCGRGRPSYAALGWLATMGYIELVKGSAYVTPRALPLVLAAKRAGYYYWAGSEAPSLVTEEGEYLDGFSALAYVKGKTASTEGAV